MDSQLQPGNLVYLSGRDMSEKVHPPSKLLCNWRNCTLGPGGKAAPAERLCCFCHRVGYCCKYCMSQDIYGHVSHNCPQNRKKATFQKVKYN